MVAPMLENSNQRREAHICRLAGTDELKLLGDTRFDRTFSLGRGLPAIVPRFIDRKDGYQVHLHPGCAEHDAKRPRLDGEVSVRLLRIGGTEQPPNTGM